MKNKEKLYIAQEDLYRLGNAGSSLISRVRGREVDIIEINGIINPAIINTNIRRGML